MDEIPTQNIQLPRWFELQTGSVMFYVSQIPIYFDVDFMNEFSFDTSKSCTALRWFRYASISFVITRASLSFCCPRITKLTLYRILKGRFRCR